MQIEYTENVTARIQNLVDEGFEQLAKKRRVKLNYKDFAFVLRGEKRRIIGILVGYTLHDEVYVDDLWVDEEYRGKGYGKDLMRAAEEKFKDQGFSNINLYTNEFQAPFFYPKLGFELEFIRENPKNPKLKKYFFIKRFPEKVKT